MLKKVATGIGSLAILFILGCAPQQVRQSDPLVGIKQLFETGKVDEGFADLEKAIMEDPARLELSNYYRAQSVKNKRFEESINFFKKQVEKSDAVNEMYYNLAFAYIDKIPTVGPMGSGFLSKRAIKQFESVLAQDPDDWIAIYGIGMNYLHWPDYFKKNASATDYLEKALSLQTETDFKPYYILTYIRLGDAYAKIGKIDEAYATWEAGLKYFPRHEDLLDRVGTRREKIGNAILQLYNPNNSIGEINTDISVLWLDEVPPYLVPLEKNPLKQAGVGGQLTGSQAKVGQGKIGLFSWFMRNLPFLSDKSHFGNVDMSQLGIDSDGSTHDLASLVAHGMIMGFLSQFEEETAEEVREKADKQSSFYRPFFHEGLGMGYAATASLDDVSELEQLIKTLEKIDSRYTRLHLAGAGMWYGLESSRNLDKVKQAFSYLGDFGEAYAYEGYGFSQTLFYFKTNPELLKTGELLSPTAAKSFYHGAGRALWILSGKDLGEFENKLAHVPGQFRPDAYSGYGMGVAFTKVENPDFVFSYLGDTHLDKVNLQQFLTGVSMGYVIRDKGDSKYISDILASSSVLDRCRVNRALQLGQQALSKVSNGGGDLHANWRSEIQSEMTGIYSVDKWSECT